ncbi:hypothetical protein NDU88_000062 [Pleurodeles waltl]|uniref:Uncharacterized protein n=1 Tax=Pleurodeles waltl TaxID=8319 RepID=A0AAV7N986_PLEWA|nr:hypothetical protein NDU88_000062 [Pleurodeles waltl]
MPLELLAFEKSVSRKIDKLQQQPTDTFQNISTQELAALRDLANYTSIIVKPADTGGAKVIMRRAMYNEECLCLLADTQHYKELTRDPTQEIQE